MTAPKLDGVLETTLYCDDLDRAQAFYEDVLGLPRIYSDNRLRGFAIAKGVLLLFRRGASLETIKVPGGTIPPHDGTGALHVAFAIAADALPAWEKHLAEHGVGIEGRADWPRGAKSIYFRDPDGQPAGAGDAGPVAEYLSAS